MAMNLQQSVDVEKPVQESDFGHTLEQVRAFYDEEALQRQSRELAPWKERERNRFHECVSGQGRVLELGSGPGRDAEYFVQCGFCVTCLDASKEMVACCIAKGLDSFVSDITEPLEFADVSFDAVFAMNSLLHVPKDKLPSVLAEVRRVLRPGGLFFMGVYGGTEFEGNWDEDPTGRHRFFAYYSDEALRDMVHTFFAEEYFAAIQSGPRAGLHFQSMLLRRP
mmetsp:Transcript_150232/g.482792  ORF Transcript_150232/g.482792 Transcript_150232/m.482792 type:complete len:223 (+) Transcript_150232:78-746(+)